MKRLAMLLTAAMIVIAATTLPAAAVAAQSAVVTAENLDEMIANAKTPAEHDAIAGYYEQRAAIAKKKAELHKRTAEAYRKAKTEKPVYMANMCDGIAAMWNKIGDDDLKLAAAHHEMAKKAASESGH